uniref:Uncharacterized protein n=1 Tax=Cacopsylla melanoneura TaxID=428564 RepID=A0A8D9DVT6_9HEMI
MTRAADSMDSGSISLRLCSSMTFFGGIFSYLLYVLNRILPSHSWSASSPSFYLLIERFLSSSFFSHMLQGCGTISIFSFIPHSHPIKTVLSVHFLFEQPAHFVLWTLMFCFLLVVFVTPIRFLSCSS